MRVLKTKQLLDNRLGLHIFQWRRDHSFGLKIGDPDSLSKNFKLKTDQCLFLTIMNFLWLGILWLGIMCVRNFSKKPCILETGQVSVVIRKSHASFENAQLFS
jgi:hypothetical protein